TGLQAGGDRADRDAGGTSAGLRSDGRQHVGENHVARLSGSHRKALRQSAAGVADGPGHSDRGTAAGNTHVGQETFYLVGTSRAKIREYEKQWLELPWQKVRESVEVKLFARDGELYVLAKSE